MSRIIVFVVGAGLGVLAFGADAVPGVGGQIVVALTSSGLVWGMAAFLTGRSARDARRAAVSATVVLVLATSVYYALVVFVSRRWSGGYLEDGRSADAQGLRSVAAFAAAWLFASVTGGPVLGMLGFWVRSASSRRAALAAGAACGLLSGEGWDMVLMVSPPWQLLAATDEFHASFVRGIMISEAIMVLLPLAVLAWLATAHRLWRPWPVLVTSAIASATVSVLLWQALAAVTANVQTPG